MPVAGGHFVFISVRNWNYERDSSLSAGFSFWGFWMIDWGCVRSSLGDKIVCLFYLT